MPRRRLALIPTMSLLSAIISSHFAVRVASFSVGRFALPGAVRTSLTQAIVNHERNYLYYLQPRSMILKRDVSSKNPPNTIMMAVDDDDASGEMAGCKTIDGKWNVPGLKTEVTRQTLRAFKRIGKLSERLEKAKKTAEELLTNPDATMEELEACPNVDALQAELDEMRGRLTILNDLEEKLKKVKGKKDAVLPAEIAMLALDVGVNDAPPKKQPRGPKKKKGPRANEVVPRKPYRKYYTKDKTEIRVGKQAEDNDELSLMPEHRDGADWWMHASGCPGSHVVIRSHDENVNEDVVKDAAALAARQSKCTGSVIKVSMVRCRNVTKPRGAKAGLVQLSGNIRTISVRMTEAEARLDRLDSTMVLN